MIVFTGDTGPSEAVTKLALGADLLVAEVNSVEDRKQAMISDGQWQVMSERERMGILQQATQAHLTTEAVGQLASRSKVKTVVLTHLTYRLAPDTENYAPWDEEVKRYFSGQVLVANDLMEF